MGFVRVKSSRESDPQHEFDVSEAELAANRETYTVVDDVPVVEAREPLYVKPSPPPKTSSK